MQRQEDFGFQVSIWVPPEFGGGLREITKSNWDGRIVVCERAVISEATKSTYLDNAVGAYVLIGTDDAGLDMIYVGEGDPASARLRKHTTEKDFWNYCIVLTRAGGELNKAEIQHLESEMIRLADEAKRCKLGNKDRPTIPTLANAASAVVRGYLAEALSVLRQLGVPFFSTTSAAKANQSNQQRTTVQLTAKGITASGYLSVEGFVVLAGSGVATELVGSMTSGNRELRQRLVDDGVIVSERDGLKFVRDQVFSSPSAAASVVAGNNSSGYSLWKDPRSGRTLAELEDPDAANSG